MKPAARRLTLPRAVLVVAGRPVIVRAFAAFVAVGIPASIVFSPSGMRAADLVHAAHESFAVRAALWSGWLLLAAPATGAAFDAPGTVTLRSLGLPRGPLVATLFVLVSIVHLPWLILFARGAGALEACQAMTLGVAVETAAIAAMRRRSWCLPIAAAAAVVVAAPPPLVGALAGIPLAVAGVHGAWSTAIEQRRTGWRLTRPTAPIVALATMHLLRIVRAGRSRLVMATMLAAAGGAGLLTLRSEPTAHPTQRALAIMALPLVLGAALLVAPALDSERQVRPLLRTLHVRRLTIIAAFLLALATPTAALAASAGFAASALCDLSTAPFVTSLATWGVALASAVGAWGRRHERARRRGAALFAAGVIVLALAAISVVTVW